MWRITSGSASRPSSNVYLKPWCTVPSASAATSRGGQVGRAFQADRERVQARPPGFRAVVVLDAVAREPRGAGRDQRRVQPARQQHAVRHVGHQLPVHGALERLAQLLLRHLDALGGVVVAPGLDVVAHQLAAARCRSSGPAGTARRRRRRPTSAFISDATHRRPLPSWPQYSGHTPIGSRAIR